MNGSTNREKNLQTQNWHLLADTKMNFWKRKHWNYFRICLLCLSLLGQVDNPLLEDSEELQPELTWWEPPGAAPGNGSGVLSGALPQAGPSLTLCWAGNLPCTTGLSSHSLQQETSFPEGQHPLLYESCSQTNGNHGIIHHHRLYNQDRTKLSYCWHDKNNFRVIFRAQK